MKKYLLSAILMVGLGQLSIAQDYRIGIKLGPTLSLSRTATDGNSSGIERDGSAIKFLIGAFVDLPFKENYHFHTGINFASKTSQISVTDPGVLAGRPVSERYDHEYLQIPLLLKLYTNEVVLDTRAFFNFGMVPELRLNTDNKDNTVDLVNEFNGFDLSGNFGGGLEHSIGVNTRVYGSLNYYIGFLNQIKEQNPLYDELQIKSNLFSLEIGIKF
ncbi:porin family protein [Roseivirga sp.]|uniref:porin family protein n=1 Tax=Roseivirga sp. TaxID=1964215 RepID=UPI003B8B686F